MEIYLLLKIEGELCYFREALIKSKCADCRADFSSKEGVKSQEFFVYSRILSQNQAEKMPPRCVRRFVQRFLMATPHNPPSAPPRKFAPWFRHFFLKYTKYFCEKLPSSELNFYSGFALAKLCGIALEKSYVGSISYVQIVFIFSVNLPPIFFSQDATRKERKK